MIRLLAVILALLTQACGSGFRDRIEIADSRYDAQVTVLGIELPSDGHQLSPYRHFLRSTVDKNTVAAEHLLYVDGIRPHAWSAASDERAEALEFVALGPRRRLMDDFGARISEEALRSRRLYGYRVKFYALDGETIVMRLTPEQIGAQLDAVDAVRRRLKPGSAATAGPAPAAPAPPTAQASPR
jgi:hypothetical protein